MQRIRICLVAAAMTSACGGADPTPTGPTAPTVGDPLTTFMCEVPSTGRVHTIPVPGTSMPLSVWVVGLAPASGATVRAGDFYEVSYRRLGPAGATSAVQVLVGDDTTRGVFTSVASGGCGGGTAAAPIPRSERSLQLYVRVWLLPGELRPGDIIPTFDRAPDYEAAEPVQWTVRP